MPADLPQDPFLVLVALEMVAAGGICDHLGALRAHVANQFRGLDKHLRIKQVVALAP